MRICLVSTSYPPEEGGGIGTYVASLAGELARGGHGLTVITKTGHADRRESRAGVEVIRLAGRYLPRIEPLLPGLAWSRAVARTIDGLEREGGIDIVEFPNWEGSGFWYARRRKRALVVTRLHTPYFESLALGGRKPTPGDRFTCWMEKAAVAACDALVCSTAAHRDCMTQAYALNPDRVTIIPLGIPLPASFPRPGTGKRRGTFTVLYVSRLERRKGTLTLLEAIPRIMEKIPYAEFVIVGKDRPHAPGTMFFKEYFSRRFSRWTEAVRFLGHVPDEELPRLYASCDVFAVPSVYESFGLIYVEAMAYGKPVVACPAGGIPEVVADRVTGFLVPPYDVRALAERVIALARDPELRKRMGLEGRRRVEEHFTSERMAYRTARFYQELADTSRSRTRGAGERYLPGELSGEKMYG